MEINLELRQYLARKRWEYRLEGRQVVLQTCPLCETSKWKFHFDSQTTQFTCYSKNTCGKTGNLYSLKQALGDLEGKEKQAKAGKTIPEKHIQRWQQNLRKKKTAVAYLHKRGITDDAIEHFRLGCRKLDGILFLTIPHFDSFGFCRNVKMRALQRVEKKDKWRRVKGYASILFNEAALDEHEEIVVAESELDAISFWVAGVRNVVGFTCGADSFKNEWYDQLADKEKLSVAFDMDKAGQKGAREIARRIGYDKVENVILPCNDANQVLQELGPEELAYTLQTAEKFEIAGVVSMGNVLARLSQQSPEDAEEFIQSPWEELNNLLGRRLRPGHVLTLSARYKMGKTTFALQWQTWLSQVMRTPTLLACLEMPTDELAEKVTAAVQRKDIDHLQPVDFTLARVKVRDMPFYFLESNEDGTGTFSVDAIFQQMSDAVRRYGIKVVVFDHLHYLCRSIKHTTQEVGQVMRRFKTFAQAHGVVVILIAQPKKLNGKRIQTDDLKDSVAVPTDSDWVVLIHRDEIKRFGLRDADEDDDILSDDEQDEEVLSPIAQITVSAARHRGGGQINLYYEGSLSTFFPMTFRKTPILNAFADDLEHALFLDL